MTTTSPWSRCIDHPTTSSTSRWSRRSRMPTRTLQPVPAGPSCCAPRVATSAPVPTYRRGPSGRWATSTSRRCGSSGPSCPSLPRSPARRSGAGSASPCRPTSGWRARRVGSPPTSHASGSTTGSAQRSRCPKWSGTGGDDLASLQRPTDRRRGGTGIGLCDRLVAADEIRGAAHALALELAGSAPLAVRAVRATLREGLTERVRAAMAHERAEQDRLSATADFREGVRAMGERREPRFTGSEAFARSGRWRGWRAEVDGERLERGRRGAAAGAPPAALDAAGAGAATGGGLGVTSRQCAAIQTRRGSCSVVVSTKWSWSVSIRCWSRPRVGEGTAPVKPPIGSTSTPVAKMKPAASSEV